MCTHRHMCLCVHTDTCVCVYTQTHESVCTHRHLCFCVRTDTCVCVDTQTHVSVCTHRHMCPCVHTDTRVCVYTHTHPLFGKIHDDIRIGPNWDEYERKRVSERTSLKNRKRTYVRICTSDVRNHFLRPIYKRPEILSNRIISEPNLGTFGLIRRKVAFFFLAVPMVVGEHILERFLAVRTMVGANILGPKRSRWNSESRRDPVGNAGGGSRPPQTPPFASAFGDTDGQVRRPNPFF